MGERGFTLVELLVVMAFFTVLMGVSMPVYANFQSRNDLSLASMMTGTMLRRAQTYSRAVKGDSQWGVNIQSSGATLFKGTSFATRDSTYDETFSFTGAITPSGSAEVVFSKLYGTPTAATTTTLTGNANETRTITVNAKGMVTYQ